MNLSMVSILNILLNICPVYGHIQILFSVLSFIPHDQKAFSVKRIAHEYMLAFVDTFSPAPL